MISICRWLGLLTALLVLSAPGAAAADLTVTDANGVTTIVKSAVIDYDQDNGSLAPFRLNRNTESEGIRIFAGQGSVTVRWTLIRRLRILGEDEATGRLKGELLLTNGMTRPVDLREDGERGLTGDTDLGRFSIPLRDLRLIVPGGQ